MFWTIGTQAPFDRFLKSVDEVAADIDEEIVAQVYKSRYVAKNIKTVDFLPPDEFQRLFGAARMIISHAGMGTIISAMQQEKPIVVFPRIAKLGEHRNEHQLATAEKMKELGYVYVANTAEELKNLLVASDLKPLHKLGKFDYQSLIDEMCKVIG